MYYCENCKSEFEEPIKEKTSFENYYGVDHLFSDSHDFTLEKCPHCGSEEIEEMKTCERCGEFCRYEDLLDTEELARGGIGDICPDCYRDCGFED